jgi:hypothetical protein
LLLFFTAKHQLAVIGLAQECWLLGNAELARTAAPLVVFRCSVFDLPSLSGLRFTPSSDRLSH